MRQAAGSRALYELLDDARRRLRRAAFAEGIALVAVGVTLGFTFGTVGAWAGFPEAILAAGELLVIVSIVAYVAVRYGAVLARALRGR